MKPMYERDDSGWGVCPLNGCRGQLYVVWTHSIPIGGPYDPNDMEDAVSSSWEVQCDNGHTVDVSPTADDYADPYSEYQRMGAA